MQAAVLGVPMVVVPFCVDQPSNGFAIERAGAGKCFPDPLATPRGAGPGCSQYARAARFCSFPGSAARSDRRRGDGSVGERGGGAAPVLPLTRRGQEKLQKQELLGDPSTFL